MRPQPLRCCWSGNSFIPDKRTLAYCIEEFGDGEVVTLERNEERSDASHKSMFAQINDYWRHLPESLAHEYPSPGHLRAKALISTGWANERSIACRDDWNAQEVAAFIAPMNDYAIIDVRGAVIRVYTAKSQSRKAMGAKNFEASKKDVLDFIANLIGVTPEQLRQSA